MRVLVTGAYGVIGAACLTRLHRDGHGLVGAGRAVGEARRRLPFAQWVEADFARLVTPAAWRSLLIGIDAVVNCVGVLQDGARDDTSRVHVFFTTPPFYDYNWTVHEEMPATLREKLAAAFLALNRDTPQDREILELQRATRFVPSKAENYRGIESAARNAGLL